MLYLGFLKMIHLSYLLKYSLVLYVETAVGAHMHAMLTCVYANFKLFMKPWQIFNNIMYLMKRKGFASFGYLWLQLVIFAFLFSLQYSN